jgi:hypothetical protein
MGRGAGTVEDAQVAAEFCEAGRDDLTDVACTASNQCALAVEIAQLGKRTHAVNPLFR